MGTSELDGLGEGHEVGPGGGGQGELTAVPVLGVPDVDGPRCEQAVYLSASALAGIARFAVLRALVFTTPRPEPRTRALPKPRTAKTSVTIAA